MSYSEKEALKPLPEASRWLKFSGTGKYDHMELIDYIDGLFIDLTRIQDYCVTAILNTEFKGHASIWYTEMKEIHVEGTSHGERVKSFKSTSMELGYGRRPCHLKMKSTWWVDKDPYEWFLRQSKRLKAIDPQMNIQMWIHKHLTQLPGELEHAVKCR
ncbi:hypothetical protein O181_047866 [Austropuccinia psidii MF-1]|uniref:Uncharacterized protein n=1 Tax=Austropuccinia psidii MF-1 TaxID=1389203 RepID=A0A9Q3HJV7_9BASI|nr:hypothetical protein [Austropuccinia psidii MF-1]